MPPMLNPPRVLQSYYSKLLDNHDMKANLQSIQAVWYEYRRQNTYLSSADSTLAVFYHSDFHITWRSVAPVGLRYNSVVN
jgi:hypothetical protein